MSSGPRTVRPAALAPTWPMLALVSGCLLACGRLGFAPVTGNTAAEDSGPGSDGAGPGSDGIAARQRPGWTGSGILPAATIDSPELVVNTCAQLIGELVAGSQTVTVADSAGLHAGDAVLLLRSSESLMRAVGDTTAVDLQPPLGGWEFNRLTQVNGGQLTLDFPAERDYPALRSQIVYVPEYQDLTINPFGVLAARPWDGSRGGVVAVLVAGTLDNRGTVLATARGHRGGALDSLGDAGAFGCSGLSQPAPEGEARGEGLDTALFSGADRTGRGNAVSGGGGGVCHNAGGAGGGNGGAGGDGGGDTGPLNGGIGGARLSGALPGQLSMGGGAGAGEDHHDTGGRGGHGGGIVLLGARTVTGSGSFVADGERGVDSADDGGSGGGAGGTVVIVTEGALSCGLISARGGDGGSAFAYGGGGGGGGGRIYLRATSVGCSPVVTGGTGGTSADPIDGTNGAAGVVTVEP